MAIGKLMAANKAANKVQNGTKIPQFGVLHSTKKTRFINWLDETAKTAKTFMRRFDPDPRLQIIQSRRSTDTVRPMKNLIDYCCAYPRPRLPDSSGNLR